LAAAVHIKAGVLEELALGVEDPQVAAHVLTGGGEVTQDAAQVRAVVHASRPTNLGYNIFLFTKNYLSFWL
jgi:hypothetical protein